jgi:hypothetical protein
VFVDKSYSILFVSLNYQKNRNALQALLVKTYSPPPLYGLLAPILVSRVARIYLRPVINSPYKEDCIASYHDMGLGQLADLLSFASKIFKE